MKDYSKNLDAITARLAEVDKEFRSKGYCIPFNYGNLHWSKPIKLGYQLLVAGTPFNQATIVDRMASIKDIEGIINAGEQAMDLLINGKIEGKKDG